MNIYIPQQFINLIPIIGAFTISLAILFVLIIKRGIDIGNKAIIGFMSVITLSTLWSFTYFFRYISEDFNNYKLWLYIEYFTHVFIGAAWLFFTLLFINKQKIVKKYGIYLIIPPVVSYIFLLTNDFHNLFFKNIEAGSADQGLLWYFPHLIISYIYIILGIILLFIHLFHVNNKIERKRTLIVALGALIPLMGNIVDSLLVKNNIINLSIDLTPIFFTFSNIFFAFAILKYRLFAIKPILFDELMSSIHGGVLIFNFQNKLLEINSGVEKLIGMERKEIIGKDIDYLCSAMECEDGKIKKFLINNKEIKNEIAHLLRPEDIYIEFTISIIRNNDDDILSKILIIKDITEAKEHHEKIVAINRELNEQSYQLRKSNKQLHKSQTALVNLMEDLQETTKKLNKTNKKLSRVDKMRKEFVSHTAHELRTPLNSIRWSLEMLLNEDMGKINRSQREILDQLYRSTIRLLGLVEDLLEVSRIDQNRFKVEIKECDLSKLIERALGDLSIKIRDKNIKLVWKKSDAKTFKIKADCDRIEQVLLNIIGNAIKYSEHNDKISIKTEKVDQVAPHDIIERCEKNKCGFLENIGKHKKYIMCSISDTGIGIPQNEQGKMFSRFFRASNAIASEEEGTGLGMTITQKIILMHEGAIWFESREGRGTTFYFTIPAK